MPETEPNVNRIRVSAVTDFYLYEMLAALRLRMTLRTARQLLTGLYVLSVPLVFIVVVAVFTLARSVVEAEGARAGELLVALAVLLVYLTTSYSLREAFSQRRFMVAGSPNAQLFRAMDIGSREVFLVYCARRICAYHLLLFMVPAGFLFAYRSVPDVGVPQIAFAVVVPFSMCAVSLSIAARSALNLRPRQSRNSINVVIACVASAALGLSTALFIAAPLIGSPEVKVPALYSSVFAGSCAAMVVVVGVTACFRLARDLARMPFHSFPVVVLPGADIPADGGSRNRTPSLTRILVSELRGSAVYPLVKRVFLAGVGGVAAIAGFTLASPFPMPVADLPDHAYEVTAGVVAVMVLGLAEIVSRAIGPTTLRSTLRTTWEAGMSSWSIARVLVLVWTGCGACAGVTAAAGVLLLADPGLTVIPMITAVCGVSAALVAETVAGPPRNTDGSAASDPITGFLSLVLTGPLVWIFAQEWTVGPALALCYALIITGVATACVRRSILKLHCS
ncbi:hypothetical protein ABZ611_24500 [Streptomyces sp. NPDC007861]|uniref:hypothetical protein n=1 Tax=Streptomyces sp. NPDC007861 TaxID=3154893 RepID=UPI0033CCFEC1